MSSSHASAPSLSPSGRRALAGSAALALAALLPATAPGQQRVEITLGPEAERQVAALGLETPVNGRVFFLLTRDDSREPRRQTGVTGIPVWGMDVAGLTANRTVVLEDGPDVRGYPLRHLSDIPAGEYTVQAFLNVYTTYRRADGHVLRMHHETGEGQNLWISPGNVHSVPTRVTIDPVRGGTIRLALSEVIPPIEPVPPGGVLDQGNPEDGRLVRFVKIRSERISRFWGRDMYIGANVLLPRDWDERSDERYPLVVMHGHFPGRNAPFGFREDGEGTEAQQAFTRFWLSDEAPRVIAITIRDANPYYDTSYSVNSINVGPYGDAIVHELIREVERRFRGLGDASARILTGGSTGGWEALAMQIFHPGFFGGAWGWCPDPVDFRYHQIVNIYEDANAYEVDHGWLRVQRPGRRRPDGNIVYMMKDENHFELTVGPNSRSGGQWAIWEAAWGPIGANGYPRPIWDPETGAIDHDVAAYWREHFDLNQYLQRNWASVGPELRGKLHIATGDMDGYYLEQAVYLLEEFLDSTTDPPAEATIEYGRRQDHCWIGYSRDRPGERLTQHEWLRIAAERMGWRR